MEIVRSRRPLAVVAGIKRTNDNAEPKTNRAPEIKKSIYKVLCVCLTLDLKLFKLVWRRIRLFRLIYKENKHMLETVYTSEANTDIHRLVGDLTCGIP